MTCRGNIWAVDNSGNISSFNVRENRWQDLDYERIEFKRVSVTSRVAWAVGSDHQIYVYVPASDIPIRLASTTYENQRWNPIGGFNTSLLPTDRPKWSSKNGLEDLPKESFKMPSKNWVWENEWFVEDNIDGEPLGVEGWTYSVDFPMEYGPERKWNSLVRRRKWLRHMRYVALNRWVSIESPHQDCVADPFIDVAVGGLDMPGNHRSSLCVWAVTVMSKVFVRHGVDSTYPEGHSWKSISTPGDIEVHQVSVGPTGLVWAVSWSGSALVRTGVDRESPYGTGWAIVDAPQDNAKIMQVSVGVDVVWAISRDQRVWFRKGVRGRSSGLNDMCATGSGWVEMVSEMSIVSVSPSDQVWAIGTDKKTIYFRTAVSDGELTGRTWKPISTVTRSTTPSVSSPNSICRRNSISSSDSGSQSVDSYLPGDERFGWSWISASSASVNVETNDHSLSASVSENLNIDSQLSVSWRQSILSMFQKRFDNEMKDYLATYPQAIEKGTWIKTGSAFKVFPNTSTAQCQLELERHGVEKDTESGTFTCTYASNSRARVEKLVINLAEIICVRVEPSNAGKGLSNILVVHTDLSDSHEPLKLAFQRDQDLDDWFTTLNVASYGIQKAEATLNPVPLFWAVTDLGAVYAAYVHGSGHFFRHVGDGCFRLVETCQDGVTWALTHDRVLYVYSGGSGGGVYKGISGANNLVFPVETSVTHYCYENQRWNPVSGFAARGLPTDRPMWSDETGRTELHKDDVHLPSKSWQWITDWTIDYATPGGVDSSGWQYAVDFPFEYHPEKAFTDYARRRRWYRKSRIATTGPWTKLESAPVVSLSLSSFRDNETGDSPETKHIDLWAVTVNGDALCRTGVTLENPCGKSWIHVPCNQPLKRISVGGEYPHVKVWAVAEDGSAFLRNGITRADLAGSSWFQVEHPRSKSQCPLREVSVGRHSVLAIDRKHRLWRRDQIQVLFPEGTNWVRISDNVRRVSCGFSDHFWILAHDMRTRYVSGNTLAKRTGVSHANFLGKDWTYFNFHSFVHISVV